jgi:phosphoenolpyruvate synthase/pyruvate phosphate dikinase
MSSRYIKRFADINIHDVAEVGGKNASLGEMEVTWLQKEYMFRTVLPLLLPHSGTSIHVSGVWGLGENIVQGPVTPDEFLLFKPVLKMRKITRLLP